MNVNPAQTVDIDRPWRDPSAKPLVEVRNLTKRFGDFTAVDDISFSVYPGEIFCLLGGSGCGKSTLLRMLSGFEKPTQGQVLIDGEDMKGIPPYRRPTNMMFQSYALFPHMSVLKNVMYGLRQGGKSKTEAESAAREMLALVKLDHLAGRKPHQLSGGQRQRVALARSLAKQPKLLLLDEPLGALDKKLREETQLELIRIQETLGVTFVVVTHDQEEAMTLATRIAVMDAGRFQQVGESADVYEYPETRGVAQFLGSVNMFEGRIIVDDVDRVEAEVEGLGSIYIPHGMRCQLNDPIWVAVRPEKIELSRQPLDLRNSFRGKIEEITYFGAQSVFHIELQNGQHIKALRANRVREEAEQLTWHDEVYVGWHAESGIGLTR